MIELPYWMSSNRLGRVDFKSGASSDDAVDDKHQNVQPASNLNEINVVTSAIYVDGKASGYHKPVLDLDVHHFYVESSTKGHAHLVIDVNLTGEQYGKLLGVLQECGIIEPGIIKHQWEAEGHTAMRLPGIRKR